MAVSVGNKSSSSGTTSSLAWSHTSNSNYMTVCVSVYDDGVSISSVQWGSTYLSLVSGSNVVNSGMGQVAIYEGAVADSGTQNVTVTLSGSADVAAGAVNWIGSAQTCSGLDTNNQDNVSASTCSVTGYSNDDYIVDAFMSDKTPTIGANQTQIYGVGFGGASSANASYEDGQYGPNMGWTSFTNGDVAHAACVIDSGGASPQSRTVEAASTGSDAPAITLAWDQFAAVAAASAAGDSPAVTWKNESDLPVAASAAALDSPAITWKSESDLAVATASAALDSPAVGWKGENDLPVAAASAALDSPQVTATTGGQIAEVAAASAALDSPQVDLIWDQFAAVAASSAALDSPQVDLIFDQTAAVAASSAALDSPQVIVFTVQVRIVAAASAAGDSPQVDTARAQPVVPASAYFDAWPVLAAMDQTAPVAAASATLDAPPHGQTAPVAVASLGSQALLPVAVVPSEIRRLPDVAAMSLDAPAATYQVGSVSRSVAAAAAALDATAAAPAAVCHPSAVASAAFDGPQVGTGLGAAERIPEAATGSLDATLAVWAPGPISRTVDWDSLALDAPQAQVSAAIVLSAAASAALDAAIANGLNVATPAPASAALSEPQAARVPSSTAYRQLLPAQMVVNAVALPSAAGEGGNIWLAGARVRSWRSAFVRP